MGQGYKYPHPKIMLTVRAKVTRVFTNGLLLGVGVKRVATPYVKLFLLRTAFINVFI